MPAPQSSDIPWPALVGQASSYWLFGAILFSCIALRLVQVCIHPSRFALCNADLCQIAQTISVAFFSPLSKIPGPVLNGVTEWPLKIQTLRGQRLHYVDALHKRYGELPV